jgi:hypothetical protein
MGVSMAEEESTAIIKKKESIMATRQRYNYGNFRFGDSAIHPFVFDRSDLEGRNLRLAMLDSFLTLPGKLDNIETLHRSMSGRDPDFYGHLAVWYVREGISREHKEVFLAHLFTSELLAHREAAFILLQDMPLADVSRIIDFCKRIYGKFPRCARTAVVRYIRAREDDREWFDGAVLKGKRYLKHIYATLRIKPSERSQKILFQNAPPPDSSLSSLKSLAVEEDPLRQADIIAEKKIPYSAVLAIVRNMTPELLFILVRRMSGAEIKLNLNALKNKGAFRHPEVKEIIDEKLREARLDWKKPCHNPRHIQKMPALSRNFNERVEAFVAEKMQEKSPARKPVALLIDKSGSIETAYEVGKAVARFCSELVEESFYVYLFNSGAVSVRPERRAMEEWEQEINSLSPGGSTSIGIALEAMRQKGERAELIIIITDGNENAPPYFANEYQLYQQELFLSPFIVIVKTGHCTERFEHKLIQKGIMNSTIAFSGDEQFLAELHFYLMLPSRAELLSKIEGISIPSRPDMIPPHPKTADDREDAAP